jgi:choline monooxygenase
MNEAISDLLALYDEDAPLEYASTIPAAWYVDERVARLERDQVFGNNWIAVGRADQVADAGQFFTFDLAGEPLIVVRGADHELRAFYNVCRHRYRTLRRRAAASLPVSRLDLWIGRFAQGHP